MPLFSVVVPAFNAGRFITAALDSVQSQTLRDYEIIVVDDGSEDETPELAEAWRRRHDAEGFRLYCQDNKGIGAARNAGIRLAGGEFIAFLDADDLWLPEKLEHVATYLERHPATDLVCHDELLIDDWDARRVLRYGPYVQYEKLLFKGNCLSTSATVVRHSKVLEAGLFSEDRRFDGVEDYDLWLRLARSGSCFAYLHEVLGCYRVHDQGITSNVLQHCQNALRLLETHFRQLPKQTASSRYLMRRRRAAVLRGAAHALVGRGNATAAWQLLLESICEDPLSWKTWALMILALRQYGLQSAS